MVRWVVVLVGVGAGSGCGGREYEICAAPDGVEPRVDVSGDVPVFDWDHGAAYAITVYALEEQQADVAMWHVQCGGEYAEADASLEALACIEVPIAYGETPDSPFVDPSASTPAKPLEPGVTYHVVLDTLVGDEGPVRESDHPDWMDFLYDGSEDEAHGCMVEVYGEADFVAPGAPDAG